MSHMDAGPCLFATWLPTFHRLNETGEANETTTPIWGICQLTPGCWGLDFLTCSSYNSREKSCVDWSTVASVSWDRDWPGGMAYIGKAVLGGWHHRGVLQWCDSHRISLSPLLRVVSIGIDRAWNSTIEVFPIIQSFLPFHPFTRFHQFIRFPSLRSLFVLFRGSYHPPSPLFTTHHVQSSLLVSHHLPVFPESPASAS